MKYYTINYKNELKEVGDFPQIQQYNQKSTKLTIKDQISLIIEPFTKYTKVVPTLELRNKAKLTDLLSVAMISPNIPLVSQAFLRILEGFRLPEMQKIKVNVINSKGDIYEYIALNSFEYFDNYLSIENCLFQSFDEVIQFNSNHEFWEFRSILNPKKLTFSKVPDSDYLLFQKVSLVKPIISEKLKEVLMKKKVSGIKFEEIIIN